MPLHTPACCSFVCCLGNGAAVPGPPDTGTDGPCIAGRVAREEVKNARARATHSVRMLSVRAYERARGGDGGGGQRAGHACPGRQRGAVRGDDAGGSARGPSCTCCSIARLSMVVCTETPAHGTSRAGPTAGGASARCACTQRTCPRKRGSNAAGSGPDARRATVSFTLSNFPSFRSHTSPRVRRTRPPAPCYSRDEFPGVAVPWRP